MNKSKDAEHALEIKVAGGSTMIGMRHIREAMDGQHLVCSQQLFESST